MVLRPRVKKTTVLKNSFADTSFCDRPGRKGNAEQNLTSAHTALSRSIFAPSRPREQQTLKQAARATGCMATYQDFLPFLNFKFTNSFFRSRILFAVCLCHRGGGPL